MTPSAEGLPPGTAGGKVWGLEHRALIHRAEHNGPGVTRCGNVILTIVDRPETYCLPDAESWWEPPDRVPFDAGGYVTWTVPPRNGRSEKYPNPDDARARFERVTKSASAAE